MHKVLIMIAQEAARGIADGLRDFIKRSLTITVLVMLLAGSAFANWEMLGIASQDRKEHKDDLREYAIALNQANRLLLEVQQQLTGCVTENQKQSAEIVSLRHQVEYLIKKKR